MANPTWKKIEKSRRYKKVKVFLKRLVGKELRLKAELDLNVVEHSDWRFNPDGLTQGAIVYSLGVGEELEFDVELIEKYGAEVHAFDPTPNTLDWIKTQTIPERLHFHPWAVTATDGSLRMYPRKRKDGTVSEDMFTVVADAGTEEGAVDVPAYCLQSIKHKLDHKQIDLLKMDIEGAEYEVLDSMIDSDFRPTQLLVEFHHRFSSIGKQATANIIERLRSIGYRIFAVSINGREVSFFYQPGG